MTHIPRIGIGGPVGSGKSMLIERLVPILAEIGYSISIISNDVISKEDADRIRNNLSTKKGLLPENMVIGLATGGCPHTAVREDPSMNLAVIEEKTKIIKLLLKKGADMHFKDRWGKSPYDEAQNCSKAILEILTSESISSESSEDD